MSTWLHDRVDAAGRAFFAPLIPRLLTWGWLRHVPDFESRDFGGPWPEPSHETPEELRTVAGIWRDAELERQAFEEGPQYSFVALYGHELRRVILKHGWRFLIPSLPRIHRWASNMRVVAAGQPAAAPPAVDPQALTDELRREADRIGLSQIGFAPYDPKYTFAEAYNPSDHEVAVAESARKGPPDQGSVIVCILEQDWAKTQTIPSAKAEREVNRSYEGVVERATRLAQLLQQKGFRAEVHGPAGMAVYIHYGVEAGLGQLGLNGQLLTPQAGSRCRLTLVTTNATLVHGAPVDYGLHRVCDECQLCVKRCPPGAIPNRRSYHRGIMKAKIKPERCLPIMAQTHGCGICQKVCPVQRYGLDAVKAHWVETGEILGKGTDELEGYHFLDGKHYGPGQKPRITKDLLHPDGLLVDPHLKVPAGKKAVSHAEAVSANGGSE